MSATPQVRLREESLSSSADPEKKIIAPARPRDNTIHVLRDVIARLNSTPGEFWDHAELSDLLTDAREALDRARIIARAITQCEESLRAAQFDQACEALDEGLAAYPGDPSLIARRRDVDAQRKAFQNAAAVRSVIGEAQWLLDRDRPDVAARFLGKKAAEFPDEPELHSRLAETENLLRKWERNRELRAAMERAAALEEREQWSSALTVLEQALQSHPDSAELIGAAQRVRAAQTNHDSREKLARRVALIRLRIAEHSWSLAFSMLTSAEKEFPNAPELTSLRREVEAGLKTSECEAVITEVRQSLADEDPEAAERVLQKGLASLGPVPALKALRLEVDSEKEYRESLRTARVLFGRGQMQAAEDVLARLVVENRREAQVSLETVRQARAASEEERLCDQGRESALEMVQRQQFTQAADLLRNLLSLFPDNPILERDLKVIESEIERKSRSGPIAEQPGPEEFASLAVVAPLFEGHSAESSPSRLRRAVTVGAVVLAVGSASGAVWHLYSGGASPTQSGIVLKPAGKPAPEKASLPVIDAPLPAAVSPPAPVSLPQALPKPSPVRPVAPARPPSAVNQVRVAAQPEPRPAEPSRPFVPPTGKKTPTQIAGRALTVLPPEGISVSAASFPNVLPALGNLAGLSESPRVAPPQPAAPPSLSAPGSVTAPSPVATLAVPAPKIVEPRVLSRTLPVYPHEAQVRGVTGIVSLEGSIDEQGVVKKVKVLSGDSILATAAAAAFVRWTYKPAFVNGKPVPSTVQLQFSFGR